MTLSDEQIQDLLCVGNPTDEECRLIRMGWDAAMRTKSAPDGWKLVPIEPTKEMRAAWDSSPICEDDDTEFRRAYSEMLAAAPEVKP